jgi:hypothetical protein
MTVLFPACSSPEGGHFFTVLGQVLLLPQIRFSLHPPTCESQTPLQFDCILNLLNFSTDNRAQKCMVSKLRQISEYILHENLRSYIYKHILQLYNIRYR